MPAYARALALFSCAMIASSSAFAAPTAFRILDLDLRDTHVYMDILGCRDITDVAFLGSSLNGDLQTRIQTDGDVPPDGFLDLNLLIIFDPLDQTLHWGELTFGQAVCTAPAAGTTCTPWPSPPEQTCYENGFGITCLAPIPGTTYGPYTPEITSSAPDCFMTAEFNATLPFFGGVEIPFQHVRVAATYVGTPATTLTNGLIMAFLPEADADAIILPQSLPVVGGQPFSVLLPDGPGGNCCATHDDRDTVNNVVGWWFYYNFVAQAVPYSPPTSVDTPLARGVALHAAVPNPFNPSTTLRYAIEESAFVRLSIFDARGRFVRDLVREDRPAGEHAATWDGRDAAGGAASSGVYFVRLESAGETRTQKIVLLK